MSCTSTLSWPIFCINGIEGKHYELIDEEQGIIAYPEGVDGTTTGYTSNPWHGPTR